MKDDNTKSIIEELEKAYNSYIVNKKIVVDVVLDTVSISGGLVLTASTFGIGTVLGITMLGGIIFLEENVKKIYQKELLQAISVGELGNTKEIEKYYKQLPKKLREEWAKDNIFAKLAKYLVDMFPEDRIYSFYGDNNFNSQELDEFNIANDINDEWIVLSGNDVWFKEG